MNWIFDILDAIPALWKMVEIKTEAMFLRQLWHYALELYRGGSEFTFLNDMIAAIGSQLTKAWREGADAVGVSPDEFTLSDDAIIQGIIEDEYNQVLKLGADILADKAAGMSVSDFRNKYKPRVEMWALRYTDTVNRAKAHFGKKIKLEWVMGETEEHCATCNRLNGMVAWADEWETAGVFPQNPPNDALECGGWRCGCRLEKTDKRRSPNALSTLLDMRVAANLGKSVSMKYDPNQARVPAGNSDGGQWVSQNSMAGLTIGNVRDFEGNITGQRIEHGAIYGNEGDFVMRRTGKVYHIKWKKEELEMARGGYLTHNHPKGTSFSDGDLMQASEYELQEMRVVTKDATFVARPPISGWPTPNSLRAHFVSAINNAKKTPNYFTLSRLEQNRLVNKELMYFSGITIEEIIYD